MFYILVNPYRLLIINEYWILIPSVLLIDYLILVIGVVLSWTSQTKMRLNYITLLNNKSLIGIFLI